MYSLVNELFSDWLLREINERGWSQADLSRAANVSRTAISNVLSQQRQPGPDFCQSIAKAFGYPAATVFQKAGILPPNSELDQQTEEMIHLFDKLTEEQQETMIGMARFFVERREGKNRTRNAEG